MATIPAAGYISNAARTLSQVQTALEDVIASLRQIPGSAQPEITSTISSGSITPAGSAGIILVGTEAAAATDDLTNIVTTNYPDGSCVVLRNLIIGQTVTAKHLAGGAGQINLDRSVDYVMDDEKKWVLLQRRGADWYEVFRGPNRLTSLSVSKTGAFTVAREDLGKTFLCSGTFTVTLTAAASLGNGFVVTIRNTGGGTLTIDPNSSELIAGSTTFPVSPGWSVMIVSDGAAWQVVSSTGPLSTQNPIINSAMDIWQRGFTFTAAANNTYGPDRWVWNQSGAGVVTMQRSFSVPSVSQTVPLFWSTLEIDVTTADATIAAGDYYAISHRMEGGTWRHFAQREFTLSFWVLSTKTGTHCVAFRNSGSDRSYVAEYTVSVTNTWEYKTVTVSASPSAGTWNYETGIGIELFFTLACGSTFQTTAGAWQTGNFIATSSQVNCLDSTSNFFRIVGAKLDVGPYATPLDVTNAEFEFLRCSRFYQKSFNGGTTPAQNVGSNLGEFIFPQTVAASTVFNTVTVPLMMAMRTTPAITFYNPNAANAQVRNRNTSTDCSSTSAYNVSEKSFTIQSTTPAGSGTAQTLAVNWSASAEL